MNQTAKTEVMAKKQQPWRLQEPRQDHQPDKNNQYSSFSFDKIKQLNKQGFEGNDIVGADHERCAPKDSALPAKDSLKISILFVPPALKL